MSRLIINGQEVDLEKVAKETKGKSGSTATKERHETFTGDVLELSNLYADIDIQPAMSNKIVVTVTGTEDFVDKLTMSQNDDTVFISGDKISRSVTVTNSSVVCVSGNDVVINTNNGNHIKPSLKITVPIYTEVWVSGATGDITIGNLQGDVDLGLFAQSTVRIAGVRHLGLKLSGQGDIVVEEITGSAIMDISGHNSVKLLRGYVEMLNIDASGMGKVDAQITAKCARLSASGMCDIRVKEVTERCREYHSGMSHITIGK